MLYPAFHQLPKIVQSYHAHATRFYRRSFFRQRKKYDANVRNKKITNNKKHLNLYIHWEQRKYIKKFAYFNSKTTCYGFNTISATYRQYKAILCIFSHAEAIVKS